MTTSIVWQQSTTHAENAENLASIARWWQDLNLQEIFWQQRLTVDRRTVNDLDWTPQGFDEKFTIQMPQMRGITLYWHKSTLTDERSVTPRQLVLDLEREQLDIYPQSQPKLVIRLTKPSLVYQKIACKDPLIVGKMTEGNYILLVRDTHQQIEMKITLGLENYRQLLQDMARGS